MSVREWLNQNPSVTTIGAIVLLGLCLWFIIHQLSTGPGSELNPRAYYYDLNTGELFVDDSSKFPPIEAPSGPDPDGQPAGVRAIVFSCSSCDDEDSLWVGYLEKFANPPTRRESGSAADEAALGATAMLVRAPDGGKWVSDQSMVGAQIMNAVGKKCGEGVKPIQCEP